MLESAINLLRALASLKLTLLGILVLLAGVLLAYFSRQHSQLYIILPLAILAANLLAAIIFNPRIRQNSGLLMFHICLLMIAVLIVLSQLTSMQGRVEVTQGTAFDADSVTLIKQGGWYNANRLKQVGFTQGNIQVEYGSGLRRGATRSQLQTRTGDRVVIGDNIAFKSHGYRFYTTSNKGFAVIVNWYAKDGSVERGAIHFPSYPLYDWKQQNRWRMPSGLQLDLRLMVDTPLDRDREWILQGVEQGRLLVTLPGGASHAMKPGEAIELADGRLEFEAVRMWMGYKIFYDPWLAWFFAAALAGVAGIAWHYYLKLFSPGRRRSFAGQNTGRVDAASTIQS